MYPILVSGPVGVGKRTVIMAASRRLNLQVVEMKCYEICSDTTAATEAKMRNMFHKGEEDFLSAVFRSFSNISNLFHFTLFCFVLNLRSSFQTYLYVAFDFSSFSLSCSFLRIFILIQHSLAPPAFS